MTLPCDVYWLMQIWECRSGSELWDDAEGVSASRPSGTDGALLWRVLLLLPLRGALDVWHCFRCFRLVQGTPTHFPCNLQYPRTNSSYLIPRALVFPFRISSPDTRLCVRISWRTIMTGWASSSSWCLSSKWKNAHAEANTLFNGPSGVYRVREAPAFGQLRHQTTVFEGKSPAALSSQNHFDVSCIQTSLTLFNHAPPLSSSGNFSWIDTTSLSWPSTSAGLRTWSWWWTCSETTAEISSLKHSTSSRSAKKKKKTQISSQFKNLTCEMPQST